MNQDHYIVRAVVLSHPELYLMEVKLIENIHQEINEETITVLGQDGGNCGEKLGYFNSKDRLINSMSLENSKARVNQPPPPFPPNIPSPH